MKSCIGKAHGESYPIETKRERERERERGAEGGGVRADQQERQRELRRDKVEESTLRRNPLCELVQKARVREERAH